MSSTQETEFQTSKLTTMKETLVLTCQCGRIHYDFYGMIINHRVCHCTDCRRTTGGPFSQKLKVLKEMIVPTKGAPKIIRFPREAEGCFTREDFFFIFTGAIQNPEWLNIHKPDTEAHMENKCAWLPVNLIQPVPLLFNTRRSPEPEEVEPSTF
ncbi:Mss4-like protein [Whalleya microplaca]|nr:Mss4-like protein [Whalleya microplaca]